MGRRMFAVMVCVAGGALLGGCASSGGNTTQPAGAEKKADTKSFAMQEDGKEVLLLDVPTKVRCKQKGDTATLAVFGHEATVRSVRGAKTIDDGVAQVNEIVKSEFKEFAPSKIEPLTISGNPAKELAGPGKEADDNDPASGVVVVFKAGERVFIALTHGEHFAPADRDWMMAIVQTAKAP